MGVYIELPKEWAKWSFDVRDIHDNVLKAKVTDLDLVRCRECKHSKEWYRDRLMCHLWAEFGVSVFEDGFCNYGERRKED